MGTHSRNAELNSSQKGRKPKEPRDEGSFGFCPCSGRKTIGLLAWAALFRLNDSLSLLRTIEGQEMIDSECLVLI